MIVNCEGCETGFYVDERLLKPGGSKVRCSKCRHVFVAYPPPLPVDDSEEPLVLSEEMTAAAPGAADADMASIAAKLDEIFDDAPAPGPAPAAEEPEMLDVADLLAEDAAEPVDAAGEKGELDFDLDLGLDAAGPETAAATESAVPPPAAGAPAEEEIDFNLDSAPAAKPAEAAGDLPDLNELELDLSALEAAVDDGAPAPSAEARTAEAAGVDLDLNFDFEPPVAEGAAASAAPAAASDAAAPSSEEMSLDLINELNLDLDSASDATTTTLSKNAKKANPLAKTDQIDLEDLENLLDDLTPAAAEPAGTELDLEVQPEPASAEAPDIDLSFLNDAGSEPPEPPAPVEAAAPPEPVAAAAPQAAESSDELDFSDLSNILEGEQPQGKKAEEIQDIELVLDDAAPAPEAVAEPQEPMLDIEALLSDDAGTAAAAPPETEGAAPKKPAATTDLEIEFEPVEEVRSAGRPAKATTAAAALVGADDVSTQESSLAGGREATDVLGVEPLEEPAPVKKSATVVPRRSGGGILKPLMAMVVVVVLALAALVVPRTLGIHVPYLTDTEIPVLSDIDLELPYIGHVGKLFKAEAPDPAGRLKIIPDAGSVTAEYVDNALAGRLLIIRGKVRNAYDHPRSAIRVSATIFGKGGAAVKSATVYAGTMLTPDELAALDMTAIQSRLNFRASAANRPQVAKPGASLPFMAVFGNLPAAIEEYSVEVTDSKP